MPVNFNNIVKLFLIYRVVSRFSFYVPICIIAFLAADCSFLEIGAILFVYGIATLFSGGTSEKMLRKHGAAKTIAYGELLKMASNTLIGLVLIAGSEFNTLTAFALLVFAQLLGGTGYCLAAVGDGSYLSHAASATETSKELLSPAQARSSSYMFISFLIAGCIGAAVFPLAPSLPFLMTAIANLSAAILALSWLMPAIHQKNTESTLQQTVPSVSTITKGHTTFKTPLITRTEMFSYAFLRAVVLTMQLLILPVWFFLGLQIEVIFFGLLFGLYTLSGFLGGRFYPCLSRKLSQQASVMMVMSVILLSMLATVSGSVSLSVGGPALFPVSVIKAGLLPFITLLAPVGIFCAAGMLRPAFLPILSHAATASGGTVNVIARAEQLFGAISALFYLICSCMFYLEYTPQQIISGATILVAVVAVLRAVLVPVSAHMARSRIMN